MSASSNKGGYGGPNTSGPGGQGRDYNGNARGSNMPGQFVIGGAPRPIGGPAPVFGGPPAQGDLYQPGGNRFMPGRGMVPPAGRIGNPRQVNPGQGPMQPGMPAQPPSYGGGKGGYPGPTPIEDHRLKEIDPGFNVPFNPGRTDMRSDMDYSQFQSNF